MSTSNKPILFFQNFFEKNHFNKFVKDFYTDFDNPTFYANTELEYIEYIDRVYIEGEDSSKARKIYFKEYLLKILVPQKTISIRLITDKIEDIRNIGNSPAVYISNTRENLTKLKSNIITSQNQNKNLILPLLEEIEGVLIIPKNQQSLPNKQLLTISSYFKPNINTVKLKKIYHLARIHEIVDIRTTTEDDFINVFLSSNPLLIENKIILKANNRKSIYFGLCMSKYFENLKPSTIARSESFYSKSTPNKSSIPLSEATINNALSFLKNKALKNKFSDIEESFNNLEKQ